MKPTDEDERDTGADDVEADEDGDEADEAGWGGVVVQRFTTRAEALAACSALEAAGIFPQVVSESPVSDTVLPGSLAGDYALLVAEEDAERAASVLKGAPEPAPGTEGESGGA